ncbi:MAG: cytochrome c [Kordiimonas sp.]
MRIIPVFIAVCLSSLSVFAEDQVEATAKFNWMMNCQGCHQANGAGSKGGAPDMRGIVSKFLAVEGGREYLSQVPGVAYAPLDDQQLADLVNWLLAEYDQDHLPTNFLPFTGIEIGALRKSPLVDDAPVLRNELLVKIKKKESKSNELR